MIGRAHEVTSGEDRYAVEEAQETRQDELTVEAIDQNPWHAILRDLPREASGELAEAAARAAGELIDRATRWANLSRQSPEEAEWLDLLQQAERRIEEAANTRQPEAPEHSRAFGPDQPTDEDRRAVEEAAKQHDRPLSFEAIRDNPWHAVMRSLPPEPGLDLADEVLRITSDLGDRAARWADRAGNGEESERWLAVAQCAEHSRESALLAHDVETARIAWREPAFSRETIDADPWTAVHLPIPEKADPELLAYARNWAGDLARYAEQGSALGEPLVNAEKFTREQNMEAAYERQGVLDGRLWLASERMDERHRDEWEQVRAGRGGEELSSHLAEWQAGERAQLEALIAGEAGEATLVPERHTEFLSGDFITRRWGESLARTAEMLLGAVLGYFVPEPELTPEQARLVTLANAERHEAMEFAAARRENAAALDAVNLEIDRHRSHIREDGPVRPDSIYERYPGLTRDENDEARPHQEEADRAFYDTGIERSRQRGI